MEDPQSELPRVFRLSSICVTAADRKEIEKGCREKKSTRGAPDNTIC
jgi:hypothetical protein